MKRNSLILLTFVLFAFSGCYKEYDIEPKYDKKNSTLTIEGKVINNVTLSVEKNPLSDNMLSFQTNIQKYISTNDSCNKIGYIEQKANGKAYIWGNLEEHLKEKYTIKNRGECLVEKISNVRFFNCSIKKHKNKKFYAIATKTENEYGYSELKTVLLGEKCYISLIEHFNKLAKKDNIKIEKYKYFTKNNKSIKNNIETKKEVIKTNNLIWQDNTEIHHLDLTWKEAKDYCKNLTLSGYSDWHLPSKKQLLDLSDYYSKLSNVPKDAWYWSSNYRRYDNGYVAVYNVNLDKDGGDIDKENPRIENSVRCVHHIVK